MDKYEHDIKIHKLIIIKNIFTLALMAFGIIYTGNLLWLLMLLLYTDRSEENAK